jgi:tRNA modification GTPase
MSRTRTLACVLTPRGRGAVATIAVAGDVSLLDAAEVFHAANGKLLAEQALNRIAFGRWGKEPAEEVVVCKVAADWLEIHCHGGDAAVARVLAQLADIGVEPLPWPEFLEATEGPFARDTAEAFAAAATARTAAIIGQQTAGPLRELFSWLNEVDQTTGRDAVLARFDRALAWSEFGRHLTQPWRVVLYGSPNVGKSSLINALAGFERAIVFDQPGTTRDVVTVETAFDGWPVRLSDTAGIRVSQDQIEAAGIARAKSEVAAADLRICVCDGSDASSFAVLQIEDIAPSIVVVNKSDLPESAPSDFPPDALRVSARTKEELPELMSAIARRLVPRLPEPADVVPVTARQIECLSAAREALADGDVNAFQRQIAIVGIGGN